MLDKYGRQINYLRISLTDKCNLRCRYCMPLGSIVKKNHDEIILEDEIVSIVKADTSLGINKIRLTGGEPLVKKNILNVISKIKQIKEVKELCITINGVLLKKMALELKNAGIDRINISIDTLDKKKYEYIAGGGNLDDAISGLNEAYSIGFDKIKINVVLIGGFNDDEIISFSDLTIDRDIDVRFIELMPMYDSGEFGKDAFIPYTVVLDKLKDKNIERINKDGGVAKLYHIKGAKGNIGLISPVNDHFCASCNRIRVTSDGKIKPCLHSDDEINIKNLTELQMKQKLEESIFKKPEKHDLLSYESRSKSNRNLNQIGG